MRLSELFEDFDEDPSEDPSEDDFHAAIALIERDCQPFLSQYGGDALALRGFNTTNRLSYFFKRAVRTDRKPMNSSKADQAEADEWFVERFGFKARSAAVFTTGNLDDAKSYNARSNGEAYAIFPIGDFKFVWSPKVGDLFMALGRSGTMSDFLDDAEYTDKDLSAALASDNEIMFSCTEYYALRARSHNDCAKILRALKENE